MKNITIYSKDNMIGKALFDEVWKLLELSFPSNERWDKAGFLSEYENAEFRSMIYCPDKLCGVLNFWELGGFVYVEHFAVQPELRGQGIGAALMHELSRIADGRIYLLEAEPPHDSPVAARRIAFYERLGFVLNTHEYIQPAMGKDEQPLPLVIMSAPKALTEEQFVQARDRMYKTVYYGSGL